MSGIIKILVYFLIYRRLFIGLFMFSSDSFCLFSGFWFVILTGNLEFTRFTNFFPYFSDFPFWDFWNSDGCFVCFRGKCYIVLLPFLKCFVLLSFYMCTVETERDLPIPATTWFVLVDGTGNSESFIQVWRIKLSSSTLINLVAYLCQIYCSDHYAKTNPLSKQIPSRFPGKKSI